MKKWILFLCLLNVSPLFARGKCSDIPLGISTYNGNTLNGFVPFPKSVSHVDISTWPLDAQSTTYIDYFNQTWNGGPYNWQLRYSYPVTIADGFGESWEGRPYNVVAGTQPRINVGFNSDAGGFPGDSDPGPYPIPPYPAIDGDMGPNNKVNYLQTGLDQVMIVIDRDNCLDYEFWDVNYKPGGIQIGTVSVFDMLAGDGQRPAGITGGGSVSGMPLFPLLVTQDDVNTSTITHAQALTAFLGELEGTFTYPAGHAQYKGSYPAGEPPFGTRLRLKSSVNVSTACLPGLGFNCPAQAQLFLNGLKHYGAFFVDGGGSIDFETTVSSNTFDYNSIRGLAFTNLFTQDNFEVVPTAAIYCYSPTPCPNGAPPSGPVPVITLLTKVSNGDGTYNVTWSVANSASRISFVTPYIGAVVTNGVKLPQAGTYTIMAENYNGKGSTTVTVP